MRAAVDAAGTRPAVALPAADPGGGAAARALADVREILQEFKDAHSRLAEQAATLQRGQEEILEFVRSVLDDESLAAGGDAGHRRRIAVVSLRVAEADEVVRGLVGAFCDGI